MYEKEDGEPINYEFVETESMLAILFSLYSKQPDCMRIDSSNAMEKYINYWVQNPTDTVRLHKNLYEHIVDHVW